MITIIFDRYGTAQNELELSDDKNHFGDLDLFENLYFEFKSKFSELLHPLIDTPRSRNSSLRSSVSGHSNHPSRSQRNNTHIELPTNALANFEGDTCSWLQYTDTIVALVVRKTTLSNVQMFHAFIASFKNASMDMICK